MTTATVHRADPTQMIQSTKSRSLFERWDALFSRWSAYRVEAANLRRLQTRDLRDAGVSVEQFEFDWNDGAVRRGGR